MFRYVPLTPCPTRAPRLPGTELLKKSISTPALHTLFSLIDAKPNPPTLAEEEAEPNQI